MKYEEAEAILKEDVQRTDLDSFKGFDMFNDSFWSGHYNSEVELNNGHVLGFDGKVAWNFNDDKGIIDVEIESIESFELFDEEGESLNNFKNGN